MATVSLVLSLLAVLVQNRTRFTSTKASELGTQFTRFTSTKV
jgi:hypothetical protein